MDEGIPHFAEAALNELVAILLLVGSLFLIPLGLPGLWLMLGVLAFGAYTGEVAWATVGALTVLAAVAELAEFLLVSRLNARYGGTPRAFWGAIAGGLVGIFVGVPVPVIGSVVAGILGSFAGAATVTLWETRHLGSATRVGWGVVLGRIFSVFVKTAAGVAIAAVGGAALLIP